jgi:hypothetical protein
MDGSKEKPRAILADGLGALVPNFFEEKGNGMNVSTTGNKTQSKDGGTLTPRELTLLERFRSMDDRAQDFILGSAKFNSEEFPRRVVPRLRLVVGGAA